MVLLVFIHKVFPMVAVKLVWVLGMPTFTPLKFTFDLMVVILCHLRVSIIQPLSIPTKTGHIIHYIGVGMINIEPMVVVEVVLVLIPYTSPSRKLILEQTGMMVCVTHISVITQHPRCCHIVVVIINLMLLVVIN